MSFDKEVGRNARFLAMEMKEKKERRERDWVYGLGLKRGETRIKVQQKGPSIRLKRVSKI